MKFSSSPLLALLCGGALLVGPITASDEAELQDLAGQSLSTWTANLQGEDVEARRLAAIATLSADASIQRQLLPSFIEIMMSEKDGQVRLAVLDTLTEMGPLAAPAVPALLHTLRTDLGGRGNEGLHQDYRSALALAAIGEPAVEGLGSLLVEKKVNVRAEAAMGLGRIGPRAAAAIPQLIPLLKDQEARIRKEAALALGRIGDAALEPLLAATEHDELSTRAGATEAIGELQTSDPRVVEVILQAARDPEPQVRAVAVKSRAFTRLSPELRSELLLENLQHDDEAVRTNVVNALVSHRQWLAAIETELGPLLAAKQDGVAWHAAFLLQKCGQQAAPTLLSALRQEGTRIEQLAAALALFGRPIVNSLEAALDDPEPRVREGAALALGQIRPLSQETVRRLSLGLDDPTATVQAAFLTALGYLGSRARVAVPAIRSKLSDPSAEIREQAVGIVFEASVRDDRLIDELSAMIGDEAPGVQRSAIEAIRATGAPGRSALVQVIAQLESPHDEVRLAAAAMVGSHGRAAGQAVPALISLLETADPDFRVVVAQTLSQLGVAAKPAFDRLALLLDDDNLEIRKAALQAIGNFDLEPTEFRPFLAKSLHDPESDVRRQASREIRRLGRRGTIFIPDLILLAADEQQGRFLKRSLQRYERYGTDPRSVPELIELLGHAHEAVKLLAAKFLGLAGPAAGDAIPLLEILSSDASEELRTAATAAIEQIRRDPAVDAPSQDRRAEES